jgi:hypothetical protein
MTFLEFLSPVTAWRTLGQIVRNEINHRFYNKKMKELEKNGSLNQFGMRLDMRNRAYYIINLEPETLLMGSEVLELEKSRVLESINLRKPMFSNMELTELIEAKTERIKTEDHYAYLVQIKYRPLAKVQDHVYFFVWLGLAGTALYYAISMALTFVH